MAFVFCRTLKWIPKIAASVAGYSLALAAAYGLGLIRADGFVRDQLGFYSHFSGWVFDSWDHYYRIPKTVVLDLIPLYYSVRFLTVRGRESRRFAVVPVLVAAFLAFECLANDSIRLDYHSRLIALPLTHLVVAALFWSRGRTDKSKAGPSADRV